MNVVEYELVFLIQPDLEDKEIEEVTQKTEGLITDNEGTIFLRDPWGRKRLAYDIATHSRAHYTLLMFAAPPEAITTIERNLRLDERVLRFLTVRKSDSVDLDERIAWGRTRSAELDAERAARAEAEALRAAERAEREKAEAELRERREAEAAAHRQAVAEKAARDAELAAAKEDGAPSDEAEKVEAPKEEAAATEPSKDEEEKVDASKDKAEDIDENKDAEASASNTEDDSSEAKE